MAQFFRERSWDIHIMDIDRGEPASELPGITLHLFKQPAGQIPDSLVLSRTASIFLVKLLRQLQPDILHSHYVTFFGWTAALAAFTPTVATVWGSDLFIEARSNKVNRRLASFTLRTASYVTADSLDLLEEAQQLRETPEGSELILFGIDTERFRPELDTSALQHRGLPFISHENSHRRIVLSIRQFKPQANIHVMVEAIPRVLEHHPETLFILKSFLTRDTPFKKYEDIIRRRVDELGLAGNVVFMGDVPADDLPLLFNLADISLSLRNTDGASCSVLESMACGTPVITGSIPAMAEWIEHEQNGLLIHHTDSQELAAAIIRLLDDAPFLECLSLNARKTAVERADYRKAWEQLEARYQTLMEKNRQGLKSSDPVELSHYYLWHKQADKAQKTLSKYLTSRNLRVYDCLRALVALGAVAAITGDNEKAKRMYSSFSNLLTQANLDTPMSVNVR